ncbi:MAG: hypothetical protein ACK4VZ_11410 [Paracoccaceae bacterium]
MAGHVAAQTSDRPYASIPHTFGDLVDYDRKLIQTEGVPVVAGLPADTLCLISAVRLATTAAANPPQRDRSRRLYVQFGGNWKPTPMTENGPRGKDILSICDPYLRADGFKDALSDALETPGSFFIRDFTGNVLQVYAPQRRIAASIRLAQRKRGQ